LNRYVELTAVLIFHLQVALKTLIVIHRTLREGDPIFRDELLSYSRRGSVFQMSNFKDDSSPLGPSHNFVTWQKAHDA
jgi:ANTH domain